MIKILILLLSIVFIPSTSFLITNIHKNNLQEKCCTSCSIPYVKYYSLAQGRCGESCLDPKDYFKYKVFEFNLTKAITNTPCSDYGYKIYNGTHTHSAGVIKATLDLYLHG